MNDFYKPGRENTSCNLLIKIAVALIAIVFLFSPLLAGRKASVLKLLVLVIVVICFPWGGDTSAGVGPDDVEIVGLNCGSVDRLVF